MHELKSDIDVDRVFDSGTPIDQAVATGLRIALRRHKALGQSIVVWRNGEPTWLKPDEFDPESISSTTGLD